MEENLIVSFVDDFFCWKENLSWVILTAIVYATWYFIFYLFKVMICVNLLLGVVKLWKNKNLNKWGADFVFSCYFLNSLF